jgi:hypothetical protein
VHLLVKVVCVRMTMHGTNSIKFAVILTDKFLTRCQCVEKEFNFVLAEPNRVRYSSDKLNIVHLPCNCHI